MTGKLYQCFIIVSIIIPSIFFDCVLAREYGRKYIEDKLKRMGISDDTISKIAAGGDDEYVLESMDGHDFEKLTPDLIANIGPGAIENLDVDRIKIMTKNMYQGNEKQLGKILGVLNKEQVDGVLDSISESNRNSSERKHLSCIQFEPLIKALKRVSGDPSKWKKDVFNKLGSDFIKCLPPNVIKNIAGNKDVFRTVLMNAKNEITHKRISRVVKKSLLDGATRAFGAIKDWKLVDLKSASSLVTMFKPKDLKQLDTAMVKSAIVDLGKQIWEEKRGKELVAKLKDPIKGFGAINSWSAQDVDRLGNLRGSLSKKELFQLSSETLRDSVHAFARTFLPPYKKRALGKRLKEIYGQPKDWNSGQIRNASDLLGGMDVYELQEMDGDALMDALSTIKDVQLPRHKGRVLAKKIQDKIGDVRHWNVTVMKMIGSLVKDVPDSMLTLLQPDEAREAVKMLRTRRDIPLSKKRVLIKQALKLGGHTSRLSAKEYGAFVAEFPLTELKKIQSVDDLFVDETAMNDSKEVEAMWNPSQARTLVEDLVIKETNWGPVSQENENWTIANIKKLGRLGLGLRKSDLDNLDKYSFPDFTAEFTRISNWTIGQAKRISTRFMEYFKDREFDMTATEITSLGDFVIMVSDTVVKKLGTETAREAVRLMGASRLYQQLPNTLRHKKTTTALELLDKKVSSLTGEEFEDLGSLVSGFNKEDLEQISLNTFADAVATFGDVKDFDKEIKETLADMAIAALGGASKFNGDILHDLGRIVEGFDSKDIAKIPNSVIVENLHIFAEAKLKADVAVTIMEKSESSRRKRRSVDMSNKTGDELIEMGSTLIALTKDEIVVVTDLAFTSAVAEISTIKDFTSDQLKAWATKAKSAWGNVTTFTDDQLLQLNEFAKGFDANELSQMSFTSDEVIANFGSVKGYTQDQLMKIWTKIKAGKSINTFAGDELKSLGVIALAISSSEIGQITAEAYQDASLELGEVQGWSSDQIKSLKDKAVATFGAVNTWSSAQMSLAGAAIGGFTAAEIRGIDIDQLDAVKPSALKQIPVDIFKEFSIKQLLQLSPDQASSITTAQRDALSPEQRESLLKAESDTTEISSGCCATKWSYRILDSAIIIQILGFLL